jgi:hypothetical protein
VGRSWFVNVELGRDDILPSTQHRSLSPSPFSSPNSFPTSVKHFEQKYLQKLFCWESKVKRGYGGFAPVDIYCHGLTKNDAKIQMRLVKQPQQKGEYKLKSRPPGHPGATRSRWKMAPLDVDDADKASNSAHTAARELNASINSQSSFLCSSDTSLTFRVPGEKRKKEESVCSTKKLYTDADMEKPMFKWQGKYRQIEDECREHGVTTFGTLKEMLKNLKAHYALPHKDQTRNVRPGSMSAWLNQG